MKVLHLGKLCPPNEGGVDVFAFEIVEALKRKGIHADLLCLNSFTGEGIYRGIDYFSCKTNFFFNGAPISVDYALAFFKMKDSYDIIHVHCPVPMAEIVSLFTNQKVILHWHSDIVRQKLTYRFYRPIQRLLLKKAEKIIVTSKQYLDTSEQLRGYKHKAVVVPLGINPARLSIDEEAQKEFGWISEKVQDKKVVLSLGRLVEYKGFEYLVKASKYLNDDIIVVIAGGGPLYSKLQTEIKKMGLDEKIILTGKVSNVAVFMKNCDVFCLPSVGRNEAFGLVLLEALYFGKPLITTNVVGSGMNYVNKNNQTGYIVPPKDPLALAEAINKILSDKELYSYFSENAIQRFKEFEIDTIADKIIEIYKEVL